MRSVRERPRSGEHGRRRRRPGHLFRCGTLLLTGMLSALVAACGTPPPGRFARAALTGLVLDTEGRPVTGAEVELDGRHTASTRLDGTFGFGRVRRGPHELAVTHPAHEPASVELRFTDRRQMAFVRLVSRRALIAKAVDALQGGELQAAADFLNRAEALREKSTKADVLLLRAYVLYRRGREDEAVEVLREAARAPGAREAAARLEAVIAEEAGDRE